MFCEIAGTLLNHSLMSIKLGSHGGWRSISDRLPRQDSISHTPYQAILMLFSSAMCLVEPISSSVHFQVRSIAAEVYNFWTTLISADICDEILDQTSDKYCLLVHERVTSLDHRELVCSPSSPWRPCIRRLCLYHSCTASALM